MSIARIRKIKKKQNRHKDGSIEEITFHGVWKEYMKKVRNMNVKLTNFALATPTH